MEAHAPSAVPTNTKQAWGLLFAQIVHQTLPLQLAAPQKLTVYVTLDTRDLTEERARRAFLDLRGAFIVQQTHINRSC